MKWTPERRARLGLCAIQSHADPDIAALVLAHGALAVWEGIKCRTQDSHLGRKAQKIDLDELIGATQQTGLRFITPVDEEWPATLKDLDAIEPLSGMAGMPTGLWVKGPALLSARSERSIAVVGSRAATSYGEMTAADLAYELAEAGWHIVSGGAYGIDLQAHRAALNATGATIAVLANGLDLRYPRGNAPVLDQIAETGLLVSECPPGSHPTRQGFLARNRLIAALSAGTILVEAAARSGARNTANWASRLLRQVMAVPGPITSAASVTPHRLIRDGQATLVASAQDVLALVESLDSAPVLPTLGEARPMDELSASEFAVRESLPARGSRSAGEISLMTGIDLPACLATLAELEAKSLVEATPEGRWKLRRPNTS